MYDENGPFYVPDETVLQEFERDLADALKPVARPKTLSSGEARAVRKRHKQLQRAVNLSTQRNGEVHATWEFAEAYTRFYGLRQVPPHWRLHEARWAYTPAFDTYKGRDGSEKTRQAYLAERIDRGFSGLALRHMRRRNGVGRPPRRAVEAVAQQGGTH